MDSVGRTLLDIVTVASGVVVIIFVLICIAAALGPAFSNIFTRLKCQKKRRKA